LQICCGFMMKTPTPKATCKMQSTIFDRQVEEMFQQYDADGNGQIDKDEVIHSNLHRKHSDQDTSRNRQRMHKMRSSQPLCSHLMWTEQLQRRFKQEDSLQPIQSLRILFVQMKSTLERSS
jgi:hypothetical protein